MAFTKVLPAGISSATNLVIDSINSAGIVTATGIVASTGTFSGNVSIAGTLTYEDVTNIDSVGIITAQSGIHVTGGSVGIGSDNPQNKLDVAGDVKILDNSPRLFFYDANANGASNATGGFEVYDRDGNKNVFCGAFAPNADNLIFGVTGSERARIDSSGNIGIGTDNPQHNLHLYNNGDATLFIQADADNVDETHNPKISMSQDGLTSSIFDLGINGTAGDAFTGALANTAYLYSVSNASSNGIQFATNGAARMYLNNSGNLGIGSDNPSRRLHVQSPGSTPSALFGNSANNNSIEVTRTGSTGSYFQVQTYTNICNIVGGPTLTFRTSDPVGSASTERLRITPSGDVGLKLTNNSTVKYGLTLAQGSTDPYKLGCADGGGTKRGAIWVNSTNDAMEFMTGTSDTQRMRIRSDGRFELTTNGTYLSATSVDYYVNAGTSRTYGFYVHKNGTGTYGSYTYLLGGNSTQYAVGGQVDTNSAYSSGGGLFYSINSNTYGIVGYWSTAAYYTLYGNGVALATGGHTTSDARLKDVQSGIGTGILDKVCSLEAKKYTWKENSQQRRSVGGGTQIGLLAQDVQEHFPEVVMEHENPQIAGHNPETLNEQIGTTYSVEYGKLTAVLIEAIKELRSENNALAERITALEG